MNFKRFAASGILIFSLLFSNAAALSDTVFINGSAIGITLSCGGAEVTKISDIKDADGSLKCPAKAAGIKEGDIITAVNGEKIGSADEFSKALKSAGGKSVMLTLKRSGKEITTKITPAVSKDGKEALIGIYVKDTSSGIGTLTFFDPEEKIFGALGHGISDSGGNTNIDISGGNVRSAEIVAVSKGEKGNPGELKGIFCGEDEPLGKVSKNTPVGIFGTMSGENLGEGQTIKLGSKEDVRVGKAYILANIEGKRTERFDIEISDVPYLSGDKSKGIVIKITDSRLLSKTGGIVRGMSGCPIVQSGRLVGAVTHVFVNDPTIGYGIFIEDMIAEAEK